MDPEWVLSTAKRRAHFPTLSKCLLGCLTTVFWITWVSKNFSLFARTTTQTVFGLLDELNISAKGMKESRGP